MFKLPYGFTVVAAAGLLAASAAGVRAQESPEPPADVMVAFLKAFEVYDYDTCRSLLLPDATITITRRIRGGSYESQHLSAWDWLDQVGGTGVHDIEGFTVNILETSSLVHAHGATATVRFQATGNTGGGLFTNNGFDTGSLIKTPDGWRILHYSSFEDFSWEAPPAGR